jgi:cytochrome c peroxidase
MAAFMLLPGCVVAGAFFLLRQSPAMSPPASENGTGAPQLGGEPILPLPLEVTWNVDKARLGERLFNDPRMSATQTIACASCHDAKKGRADDKALSPRFDGKLSPVNTPTLFNVRYNFTLFWNGRADTLWQEFDMNQAAGVNWERLPGRFGNDPAYVETFGRLYPREGISVQTIRDALFHFENSLVTPNARFDRYLRGDKQAISASELRGYQRFKSYGCVACHQGVNVGGNLFQKFGIMGDYFADRGITPTEADFGRYNATRREADKFVFRVPSLRNVALTAPYFHDGSAHTLEDAVTVMAHYQLGRPLPASDKADIVAFLKTLTGEYQGKPLAPRPPEGRASGGMPLAGATP